MTSTWQEMMNQALTEMLKSISTESVDIQHFEGTPTRVVRMWEQCLFGPPLKNAEDVLQASFEYTKVSEMIHINEIQFTSFCVHHLVPILAVGYFAYIPDGKIVGLSKIARVIEIVAQRPQIQEHITDQVVEIFDSVVKPKGCGFVVDAQHLCMIARGVKKLGSWVRTSSLRGQFLEPGVKQEFLSAIPMRRML